jgi:hypothetical protein
MSYKCLNCDYKTKKFADIKKHINLKKSCIKKLTPGFEYNIDQIIALSLLPYDEEGNQNIDKDKLLNIKYINNNKKILLDILNNIDKNKNKTCCFCNKYFTKIQELRQHILLDCFSIEMAKNNKDSNIKIENNTTNNIINITVNIPQTSPIPNLLPLSFDKSWNLSEIDEFKKKYDILYSEVMYTTLLEKILENKINLNVILDTEQNIGFVYQNEIEKYVKMNIDDIVQKSMEKLRNNLLELNNTINNNAINFKTLNKSTEERINDKLNNYNSKPDVKKYVDNFIAEIFDKKKFDAYNISKSIENIDSLEKLGY